MEHFNSLKDKTTQKSRQNAFESDTQVTTNKQERYFCLQIQPIVEVINQNIEARRKGVNGYKTYSIRK